MIPILESEYHWTCPNCVQRALTYEGAVPQARFHQCAGLAGMVAPMVQEGVRCKVEAKEREDYIGDEIVRYDGNNRPVASVEVTREDGNDEIGRAHV